MASSREYGWDDLKNRDGATKGMKALMSIDGWLTDEIIDYYFEMLAAQRPHITSAPSYYCNLKNNFREFHVSLNPNTEHLLAPVSNDYHWFLVDIVLEREVIQVFDSMNRGDVSRYHDYIERLKKLLSDHLDKPLDCRDWPVEVPSDIPQQGDSFSCGICTMAYAEFISGRRPIEFQPVNMNGFRYQLYESIRGGLIKNLLC